MIVARFTAPNGDQVETDNPGLIFYYRRKGYLEVKPEPVKKPAARKTAASNPKE